MNLKYSEEVKKALEENLPIVALESTIISHGMPYPDNVNLASELEDICRDNGVIPATIAIIKGEIHIGLENEQLEYLGKSVEIEKASIKDIPEIIASGKSGATTVAGTLFCCSLAGVEIFATGGMGGVHKNAEETFDISADLHALASHRVILVSAGAKAILDLPKTLEYMETLSIPVFGYKTNLFPAFYSSKTNLKIKSMESAEKIAAVFNTMIKLNVNSGLMIANPVPEQDEIPAEVINKHIQSALDEADRQNITGAAITPFLLQYIVNETGGASLKANKSLVRNNVRLACKIAKNLKDIKK